MKLSETEQRFVLHWGEMGSRWGVNRTISQIHALLYLADEAMAADEIAETLSVARSNVSTSLKELQSMGLVKVTHVLGDRKDHFQALQDVWEIFHVIMEERRKREIDPTLSVLRESLLDEDEALTHERREKIESVMEFLEMLTKWHDDVSNLPRPVVLSVFQMGARIQKLVGGNH